MRRITKFSFLTAFLLVIFSHNLQSQVLTPVKWSFSQKQISTDEVQLIYKATIETHWHLYSQDVPGPPDGPFPTSFTLEKDKKFEQIGKVKEPKPIEENDKQFGMVLKYFEKEATFTQIVKVKSDKDFVIKGVVEYMVCDDKQCLPPTENEFEIKIKGIEQTTTANDEVVTNNEKANNNEEIIADSSKNNTTIATVETAESEDKENKSLWGLFFFSFLAGLAAILTPCVFPMIPMTVTFFLKEKNSAKAKMQAIFYGISIIFIYTIIGTLVAITLGANFANFLSTHWIPNILFFLIFMFFAASFFGMFEITLPSWLVNKSDAKADKGGILGAFFMAFTLVLVSFSCTGPIVGAILVASAGGQVLEPIIGMLGFSLAFALPFTLFAFFPSWLNNMPKSGGWLNSVKVVLGFIELALGLKFLSIADQTYHWGILDREIYLAIWIVVFTLMGFYLLGKIKFAYDSDVPYIGVPRLLFSIITFTFVVYMIPGMFGAPLKALSGYVPPQTTQDFDINKIVRENAATITTGNAANNSNSNQLCDTPKHGDIFHLPHGLQGYFDYEQALKCSKEQNKPLFIDFTGHGCVNCREMESRVWANPEVLKRLKNNFIVVALYVDDKTSLPEAEWITSKYDGKVKKTIGKKYADFQIDKFNVNAQPYYVLMNSNGEVMVTPQAYNLDVDNFIKFLDKGIAEFEKK